ncbi:MAG: septum formation inhibitor Maf [Methylocystaceae bacterium]|nr:MAG: septum formation inhibitor Maf [Methylocystaceae bacterium]
MTAAKIHSFWLDPMPLALASKSKGRRLVLEQTGIDFTTHPAEIDERAIEAEVARTGGGADEIATRLARDKALAVSAELKGRLVLGADQVASCEGRRFGKPADVSRAAEQLRFLAGREHRLHSAAALVRDGAVLFETIGHADLKMRPLSDAFIGSYLAVVGADVAASAGAYQIEGLGIHLFERIAGDHWTILGLPLLPILEAARALGVLRA